VTASWVSEYREITDETRMAAYAALGRPALRDIRIVAGLG
jgi:hypothetical protein